MRLHKHDEQIYDCLTLELPRDNDENIGNGAIGIGGSVRVNTDRSRRTKNN